MSYRPARQSFKSKSTKRLSPTLLTTLGVAGVVTSCSQTDLALTNQVEAQALPSATPTITSLPPTATPTFTPSPTPTFSPTSTPWPSPTPWPTPASWAPIRQPLPTLAPIPVAPTVRLMPGGNLPVSYSPPDGVDVFGNTILRWSFGGELAPDEFFDIKIKPVGSNDSVFVDWSKSPEYQLRPWSGWTPGLYTWQIGIVKGYLEGDAKHFIADTGRDSQPFLIKWQLAGDGGNGGSGSGSAGGGGGASGGS